MAYGMTAAMRRYEQEQDRAAAEESWIQDKSYELMQDECNPNDPENFVFAIGNASDNQMKKLGELLKKGDATAIGQYLLSIAEDYWIQESESMAEDILLRERNWQ